MNERKRGRIIRKKKGNRKTEERKKELILDGFVE